MNREDMRDQIRDIHQRRMDAFGRGEGKGLSASEHLALIPEATTADDIQTLHAARRMLDDFSREVLDLYADVWQEWGDHRCSVCAMTAAQAAAAGHDCTNDC